MHRRFFRKNFSTFILKMMTFVKNLKIYQAEASLNLFYRVYLDVITTDNTYSETMSRGYQPVACPSSYQL